MPEHSTISTYPPLSTHSSHHRSSTLSGGSDVIPTSISTDLSLPLLPPRFEEAVDAHYTYHSSATRIPHKINASFYSTTSAATSKVDGRISLSAKFLASRENTFRIDELPPKMVPFWAYKDFALYITGSSSDTDHLGSVFDRMYSEWYPTRDRTVFDDGILRGAGSPFAAATMRINWAGNNTASDANIRNEDCNSSRDNQSPARLLAPLIELHTSLVAKLDALCPQFEALHEGGARMLVRPEPNPQHQSSLPSARKQVEYLPVMQNSFRECFLWLDESWKEGGVKLVILGEDMLSSMLFGDIEDVWRDVEFEEAARRAMGFREGHGQQNTPSERNIRVKALLDGAVVFKDSLENAMRIVLIGDEKRNKRKREWNPMLEEWLGKDK